MMKRNGPKPEESFVTSVQMLVLKLSALRNNLLKFYFSKYVLFVLIENELTVYKQENVSLDL